MKLMTLLNWICALQVLCYALERFIQTDLSEESDDAFMQEMMRQMESLTDNGDFQNMLEGMMNQLMSKDLLYEPMKDLANKVRT